MNVTQDNKSNGCQLESGISGISKISRVCFLPLILLFGAAFLSAAGCGGGGGRDIETPDIYSGTQGLKVEFLPDAPPENIYEKREFMAGLMVTNDGPIDIEDGVISLSIEEDFLEVISWDIDAHDLDIRNTDYYTTYFSVFGKTVADPEPKQGIMLVRLYPHELPVQTEVHTTYITATACYDYKTILSEEVCIEADLYDTTKSVKVCNAREMSFAGQGGPVAVTRIVPTMMPSAEGTRITPHFRIFIKNSGNGAVISTDSAELCSSDALSKEDVNKISIKGKLFNTDITCTPETFRLDENGEAEVECELASGVEVEQDAYMSVLVLVLDYGYTFSVSDKVTIRKPR